MLYLKVFTCLFTGIFCLFPMKDCQSRSRDILFIIDCRGQLEQQIELVQKVINYISKDSLQKPQNHSSKLFSADGVIEYNELSEELTQLKPNHTIMMFPAKDIIATNNLTYILDLNLSCNKSFPVDEVFNASDVWFTSRDKPLVTIILIYDKHPEQLNNYEKIIEHQKKGAKVDRFFLIPSLSKLRFEVDLISFFYPYTSFHDLSVINMFSKICETSCTNYSATFNTGSSMTSYYHVAGLFNMSHDKSSQYCKEMPNSYLVSLESPQEVNFLNNLLSEYFTARRYDKQVSLPVGIKKKDMYSLYWESGNPFVFLNSFYKFSFDCYFINISYLRNKDFSIKKIENLMFADNCSKIVNPSMVICECHVATINPDLSHDLIEEASQNKDSVDFYYFSFALIDLYIHPFFPYDHGNVIKCVANSQTNHDYTQYFVCNKGLTQKVEQLSNEKNHLSIIYNKQNRYYKIQHINISDCKTLVGSIQNGSLHDLGFNEDSNLICANKSREKDSSNSQTLFNIHGIQCGTNTFECDTTATVKCPEKWKDLVHRCIKTRWYYYDSDCISASHLQECQYFQCPKGFIKCPNSYCIYGMYVNDGIRDCPFGEDEIAPTNFLGFIKISLEVEEFCHYDSDITKIQFLCTLPCPKNYKCFSNRRIEENGVNKTEDLKYIFKIIFRLYSVSNVVYALVMSSPIYSDLSPFLNIVELYGSDCRLDNFDFAFQYWNLLDLIVLDLSSNEFISSNDMRTITNFSQLKVFNLSHNKNLTIDKDFVFPTSLEIIDLSFTKTSSLKLNVFENVTFLRRLNLSNTFVSTFQDMGIPEYFTLETLYIENVEMTNIKENFFRGLTINSELRASDYKLCCPQILNPNISADKCHAPVDVISSCKHLVGDNVKRITIWFVGLVTLVGNGIVLVYRIGWNREIFKKAYGLFISGLAVSDFIMGIYLILIASVDIHYKNIYVLEDVKWRHSVLCQFAGFLSTISSETSTFFICLITIDRFLKITFPFGQHTFTKTGKIFSFTLVWFFGFLLALIPILSRKWDIYSSNGLCLALPFSSKYHKGWMFSFTIFVVLNFLFFIFILFGQILIFANIRSIKRKVNSVTNNKNRRSQDLNIAKKLALVAMTDFMCWFPVGILGFQSLNGYIFDREVYAWIAVFVLPINSAINPIIYTLPAIYQKYRKLF